MGKSSKRVSVRVMQHEKELTQHYWPRRWKGVMSQGMWVTLKAGKG